MKFSRALILASSLAFFACDDSTSADNGSGSADCSVTDGVKVVSPKAGDVFKVGETIKVNDGPFKDFDGVIEEISDEKKKLKVSVKIFGRKTPLELNFDQVIKEA